MADPISLSLAAVGTAAAVGGGITSAIGSKYSGDAKANMYNYQAGVAKINEQIEQQNADYARKAGETTASEIGVKTSQAVGLIRAGQGASGVDVNSGSTVKVQEGQLKSGQFDEATTRSNAARTAYGYETGAIGQEASANLDTMGATASRTAGDLGATASILGTVGSVATKWIGASSSFGGGSGSSSFLPSSSFLSQDTFMPSI